ncbi:MAG: cytochrome P450 [Pseudomonadota bacterium]
MTTKTITRFEAASQALKLKDLRQALYDTGAILMGNALVNLHGEEHRKRRNLEARVFRRDFFRYYETEVFPRTLNETLAPFLAAGKMDIVDFGYKVLVNLTLDFAGIDRPQKTAEETEDIISMLRLFARTATLLHSTEDHEEVRQAFLKALARFDAEYFTPSAEHRKVLLARYANGDIEEDELPRDILTILLRNEDNIDMTHDIMVKEIAFFALAGAHTSINTLTHAMHEILTWCAEHPEDNQKLANEPLFVQKCVHESIRLHPSSPIAARRPACPMHMDGEALTESDEVIVDLEAASSDPDIFGADAASFNPHRETPKGQKPYGLSFGLGMHSCLGLNLAAGALPQPNTDSATHHYGTITMIVRALLDRGVQADPEHLAQKDTATKRNFWASYPAIFGEI